MALFEVSYWGSKAEVNLAFRDRAPITFAYGQTKVIDIPEGEKLGSFFKIKKVEAGAPAAPQPQPKVIQPRKRKG